MNQEIKLKELRKLSYFDKNTLSQFIVLSDNSMYANIKRWLKTGKLIQLKKGMYVTAEYIDAQKNPSAYTEFLANKLREPSYLSMEYALQKYGVLSESVFGLTSVTLKSKRIYRNRFGVFVYRGIKEELFDGYDIKDVENLSIKIATKGKALFDFFYYKLLEAKSVDIDLIKSFRLNYDELSQKDIRELAAYCKRSEAGKMIILMDVLKKII